MLGRGASIQNTTPLSYIFGTISVMFGLLKKEEEKPISFASLEMRKSSNGYFWWIVGAVVLVAILFIFLLKG